MKITVFDKDFQRKGWLGSPESVEPTPVFNGVGGAEVTFPSDHPQAKNILADGARLVIEYDGLDLPLMTGPVRSASGSGPAGRSMTTVTIEDDWRLFHRVLGWPVPDAPLSAQTSAYRTYTGPAETVLKTMVSENVARLGLPVTVAPDLGRGANITVKIRFHPLAERLFPAVEEAGLGVRCYQSGAGLVVDVYEPTTYSKELSEKAGTVTSWSWASSGPAVTRAVAGGEGEGTARVFARIVSGSLETKYGDVIEAFVDARNSDNDQEVYQSVEETLAEGRPTAGFALELSETKHFRYGVVQVGDRVTVNAGGLTVTDVLRSASLSWTRDEGLKITPTVGEVQDSTEAKTMRAVKRLWSGLTNLKVR